MADEQNTYIYGITGGPYYINKLNVKGSLDDALLENIFERSSYLFEEPENLLKQELRETAMYNSIIRVIAEGASKLNEIAIIREWIPDEDGLEDDGDIDLWEMYDAYIRGEKEIAEINMEWTMPIRNWGQVYGELSIMYEGRLPE